MESKNVIVPPQTQKVKGAGRCCGAAEAEWSQEGKAHLSSVEDGGVE